MRIDWVVTCRYAESAGPVGTIVGAGTDLLYVPVFPSTVGIMLAIRLAGAIEEVGEGQAHPMSVAILGPDGNPVRDAEGSAAPPSTLELRSDREPQQVVPGWAISPLIALAVTWIAEEEGAYTINVALPGTDPKPNPVHVLQAPA